MSFVHDLISTFSQMLSRRCRASQGLSGKESACQCRRPGDSSWSPWSRSSPGGGNGNPLQYSCLGNPMDRGGWRVTVHGVTKSQTWLSDRVYTHYLMNVCIQIIASESWNNGIEHYRTFILFFFGHVAQHGSLVLPRGMEPVYPLPPTHTHTLRRSVES